MQRDGLVVERAQRVLLGIELPSGIVIDLVGGERELDDPAARGILPAGPALIGSAQVVQPLADGRSEGLALP